MAIGAVRAWSRRVTRDARRERLSAGRGAGLDEVIGRFPSLHFMVLRIFTPLETGERKKKKKERKKEKKKKKKMLKLGTNQLERR